MYSFDWPHWLRRLCLCLRPRLPLPLLLLSLAALLAGCGRIPLSSLWALRQFDLERFDIAQLQAAVLLPAGWRFQREALMLDLTLKRGATGEALHERLQMTSAAWPAGEGRPAAGGAGEWTLLRLDARAQARLAALRAQALAWKAVDAAKGPPANELRLDAEPALCRAGAAAADPVPRISAWLKWAEAPGYVQLLDAQRLLELWPDGARAAPPCGA